MELDASVHKTTSLLQKNINYFNIQYIIIIKITVVLTMQFTLLHKKIFKAKLKHYHYAN